MRLIDVHTFQLRDFTGRIEPYAILSHVWNEAEVTFQDMRDLSQASRKEGFWKIKQTCLAAREYGLNYAWVDTCCIDKTSSAELQEAINSMFNWYREAAICYAYLSDVTEVADLEKSRWFTRGWTLQELLAPASIDFLGHGWTVLGSRTDLRGRISARTGIDEEILEESSYRGSIFESSIAKRMSWAAGRATTRPEDRAYSLMGLFEVSMPLLYGEGDRAFIRLQEEIFRINPDLSLLLWEFQEGWTTAGIKERYRPEQKRQRVLAPDPDFFAKSGTFYHNSTIFHDSAEMQDTSRRSLSSVALLARLPFLARRLSSSSLADDVLLLNCFDSRDPFSTVAVRVRVWDSVLTLPALYDLSLNDERLVHIDATEAANAVIKEVVLVRHWEHLHGVKPRGVRNPLLYTKAAYHDHNLSRPNEGVDFVLLDTVQSGYHSWQSMNVWPQAGWADHRKFAVDYHGGNLIRSSTVFLVGATALRYDSTKNLARGPEIIILSIACAMIDNTAARKPNRSSPVWVHLRRAVNADDNSLRQSCEMMVQRIISNRPVNTRITLRSYDDRFQLSAEIERKSFGWNDLALLHLREIET